MKRKDIIGEICGIALVFILMGLIDTIFSEWGNLSHLDTWLQAKYYNGKNLAICLIFSRTLYCYLPTQLNKWCYVAVVTAIWGALTALIMLVMSSFVIHFFLMNIVLGFLSALFHKTLNRLLFEPQNN